MDKNVVFWGVVLIGLGLILTIPDEVISDIVVKNIIPQSPYIVIALGIIGIVIGYMSKQS